MDKSERLRDVDAEYSHRGCGAVVSVGAYGDWHYCEACEVTARRSRRPLNDGICLQIHS